MSNVRKSLELREKRAEIWEKANAKIREGGFRPRDLIARSNVAAVCTTDDPADTLEYHKLLAEDKSLSFKVLPAFRPDKTLYIDLPSFIPWLEAMEKTAGTTIDSYAKLKEVLIDRINFFEEMGCKATDHAFLYAPYIRATEEELEEKIKAQAESVEKSYEEYRAGMPSQQVDYIRNSIVIDKLFAFLLENNKIA